MKLLPEIRYNPLCTRIVKVFSSHSEINQLPDGRKVVIRYITFNDFLEMMNCFSPRSTFEIKSRWCFKLYDFNEDNFIDTEDITTLLYLLLGDQRMNEKVRLKVAQEVFNEADLDGNKKLAKTEFNRVLRRLPDFLNNFQFSIQFD